MAGTAQRTMAKSFALPIAYTVPSGPTAVGV
jgi:hypothetical protein